MAKNIERLTDRAVRNIKTPGKYPDGDGLYLVVLPTGTKTWRLRYWFEGREKQIALGTYDDVGLAEARRARAGAKASLRTGIDPSAARRASSINQAAALSAARQKRAEGRAANRARSNALTFGKLALQWFDHFAGGWRNAKHRAQVWQSLETALAGIWNLPANDVKPSDVRDIVVALHETTPEVARRTLQRCAAVYRWGVVNDKCSVNPAGMFKPRDIFPRRAGGEERHFARVGADELPALLTAIATYRGWQTRLGLRLLAYTFVRTGEIRGATWSEIDLDNALWRIPAKRMKSKREHLVPLSRQAVAALRELYSVNASTGFVLPMEKALDRPASENVFLQALVKMGYGGRMTGHGFRAIASTQLRELGFPEAHIEKQLAHVDPNKTRRAYDDAEYLEPRKQMMQQWADWLDSQLTPARKGKLRHEAMPVLRQ